ncbi:hypothetical protein [Vreelandella profundi]|uniref:hypothetical protein n=1 Tax=Vreelandella profundi TaxID=2852117 RepID=UPI001EEFB69B|nr:hypothetical protein [Halomonas profundi]
MAYSLDKEQRRRLSTYLKKGKPEGWRNLLEAMNNGPGWKQFGLYYECVRFGSVSDNVFWERWSVGGQMLLLPSVATHTEKGLTDFLLSIRQQKLSESSSQSSDQPSTPPDSSTLRQTTATSSSHEPLEQPPSKPTSKEKKRTISMMIEPSLYDEVKRLADLKERSVGAQIRHSLKQSLKANAHLLGYDEPY